MFTGLIEETGIIKSIHTIESGLEFTLSGSLVMADLDIDHSIAINGVCLTVVHRTESEFVVQAIRETIEKTTISRLTVGESVNLERAMLPTTRMGGHFVQGHVNGLAEVISIEQRGENYLMEFRLADELMRYCTKEGSIAIDGISLTIADLTKNTVSVSIIPHTWKVTVIHSRPIGSHVNIEVDMFAKMIYTFMFNSGRIS